MTLAKSMVAGNRASVRAVLSMRALRDRLVQAGKPSRLALVATARKLLTILDAEVGSNQPWRPTPA